MDLEPVHQSRANQQKLKSENSPRMKRTSSSHESPWKQIKSSSQQINGRYHHASVLDEDRLYVYGGFDNDVGILADFKVFNCKDERKGWKSLSVEGGPGPRHSHSSVLYNGVMYLFGGKVDRFKSTNSLHSYSLKQNEWRQLQPHWQPTQPQKNSKNACQDNKCDAQTCQSRPAPVDSHQAVVINNQMVVYGGFSNNQFRNDIYAYTFETRAWIKVYPAPHQPTNCTRQKWVEPQPRSDFSLVAYNNKLYIYGGKNMSHNFGDFWEFDLELLKFRKIEILPDLDNRSGHSAVVYQNSMLIFGGITSVTHERDDLLSYCFQTSTWTMLWTNCEDRENKKRIAQKKLSNTKIKSTEANQSKSKHDERLFEKPRKYRRPLAEEKLALNFKKEDISEKQRYKKQNERKYLLISELQSSTVQGEQSSPQQQSPLIESLSNSIMLTSNAYHSPPNSSSRETQKHQNICQTEVDLKSKRVKARDGHSAHVLRDQMIVFGGDRHMFAINDILCINLENLLLNANMKKSQSEGKVAFDDVPKILDC